MRDELLGGRYRLGDVLGRGGAATVWRAWDTRLDRPVAVKMLNRGELAEPSAAARFDREARTVARLTHPNIVSVYDVGTHDGSGYIVMELVDGVTVASMLADDPLPIGGAAAIARQTADALGAAHARGIIHRDVKPANIMVTPGGTVKVCDFGIARELHSVGATLTAPDAAIGTAAYMAPEQATGSPVDPRTDLYALGCVLYAMLTGQPPFTGGQPIEVLYQQLHNSPTPVRARRPEVPPAIDALVTRLLAKDPADRPADAAAVRAALDHPSEPAPTLVAGGPGSTLRPVARAAVPAPVPLDAPAWYPAGPGPRDRGFLRPVLVALVAVALLIAAAFVVTSLLAAPGHGPRTAAPPSSKAPTTAAPTTAVSHPASSASPSTAAAATPGGLVDPVRTVVQQLVSTGQLDPKAANDLNHQLDGIDRDLGKGRTDDASHKVGEIRDGLGGLVRDGKLSTPGYVALTAALDTLAAAIPPPSDQGGG